MWTVDPSSHSSSLPSLLSSFCGIEYARHVFYVTIYSFNRSLTLRITGFAMNQNQSRPKVFNPFTTPACKSSVLIDALTRLQTLFFLSYNTCTFSALHFYENPFTYASAKKKTKRLRGFKFGTFTGRFQVTSWQ